MAVQSATPRASRLPLLLLCAFVAIWSALAIRPWYRQDWLLENLLVFVALPVLWHYGRRRPFSNPTYVCLFLFFVLHEIGAHYTYSEVPYDRWLAAIGAADVAQLAGRNHYDRLVHFAYGLLVTPAAIEIFARHGRYPPVWAVLFPLFFITAHSVIYEMVEWLAALVFGGELGQAYLGTQGDVWDAQKDMALAGLGAALTVLVAGMQGRLPILRP
jgi:putative membrane protein